MLLTFSERISNPNKRSYSHYAMMLVTVGDKEFQTASDESFSEKMFTAESVKICATILFMEQGLLQRITINPKICHGKPTIRNKRYPVENMLELMASGMTNEEILADYEDLEKEDLLACLLFAAKLANVGSITELVSV